MSSLQKQKITSSLKCSLPVILNILETFKKFSGYELNFQKSEYFPVNYLANALPQNNFPFKKVSEGFKYLGIFVSKSFTELAAKNFDPLLECCKEDLARWSSLPLSPMGRANLIKIVTLPRFLYPLFSKFQYSYVNRFFLLLTS